VLQPGSNLGELGTVFKAGVGRRYRPKGEISGWVLNVLRKGQSRNRGVRDLRKVVRPVGTRGNVRRLRPEHPEYPAASPRGQKCRSR
jgi:hypothetical protein